MPGPEAQRRAIEGRETDAKGVGDQKDAGREKRVREPRDGFAGRASVFHNLPSPFPRTPNLPGGSAPRTAALRLSSAGLRSAQLPPVRVHLNLLIFLSSFWGAPQSSASR